ncbi:hypothetical protein G7Y89_g13096 [Cudoniella acicularis]|uniref:6-phosphogluconate dehydrogenase NADP-binding domain-containing protein n=1 Tax=Cudoniella acicularis TaxID=354080 RepID=A0A8H4RA71_9HELO|nr:hypothetical protein G7Y89_g13096 [Cudoniella acicularis]
MALQLAFLGMGGIGRAMSKNLALQGNLKAPIIIWNRTLARAIDHSNQVGSNALVAESIQEAVFKSDIIWSSLGSQEAVLQCFDTILKENVKGKLFVECSTITPEVTDDLSQRVIEAGAEFVAMPVFGEPSMANAALLTCLPAGPAEPVKRVLPFLMGVVCRAVIDLSGEPPGTASHLKLVGNVLILQMIESVAEAHVLAEKTNLAAKHVHSMISSVFPGPFAIYSNRMTSGNYCAPEPLIAIGMIKEVADHVNNLAKQSGTELGAYKIACRHVDMAKKHAGVAGDVAGIYGAVRVESGLSFEN